MHEVLVNRLGGLSLPRKSVVRLTDRPDMTLDVYRGRKTTIQQQQQLYFLKTGWGHLLEQGCLLRLIRHLLTCATDQNDPGLCKVAVNPEFGPK